MFDILLNWLKRLKGAQDSRVYLVILTLLEFVGFFFRISSF